jgi:hypothetical protein
MYIYITKDGKKISRWRTYRQYYLPKEIEKIYLAALKK